uniref:Ricin B lectin domain-containing protein n=1 Tax=Aureoumbra lagunensis TaxID=44058 RepID=A0A7S3NDY1_9STRA
MKCLHLVVLFQVCQYVLAAVDDGLIRDAEAYWIIDPTDQTCLTELGTFGACDDDALFMYLHRAQSWWSRLLGMGTTRRSLTMVLEPIQKRSCLVTRKSYGRTILGGGDCAKVKEAQQWEMLHSNTRRYTNKQNDDAVASVALTTNGKRDCVVRDSSLWSRTARLARALAGEQNAHKEKVPRGALANTVSVHSCDKRGHTPLELTASNVAQSGFLFQAADGANCYDGIRFRACSDEDRTLRWGIAVKFNKRGRPETALYKFYNASACLVESGRDGVTLGSCASNQAKLWGVTRGRLCRNGDCVNSGKCLARSAYDSQGKLHNCNMNIFEHLTLTLDSDGSDAYVLFLLCCFFFGK